jgi:hypothetical protein
VAETEREDTGKEHMAQQEKLQKFEEKERVDKALRVIGLGIVNIMQLIHTSPEKRSSEDNYYLSVYLAHKVAFFSNGDFSDR